MLPGDAAKIQVCSVLNHETTSGNLISRYLRWKTPAYNVCFTKEACQIRYAFNLAFLVIWTLTFNVKGRRDVQGHLSLFMIKWYSQMSWRTTQWLTFPNISQVVCYKCPIVFSFSVCSVRWPLSWLHSREGHCLRPAHYWEGQWRNCTQLSLSFALMSLQSCFC